MRVLDGGLEGVVGAVLPYQGHQPSTLIRLLDTAVRCENKRRRLILAQIKIGSPISRSRRSNQTLSSGIRGGRAPKKSQKLGIVQKLVKFG